MNKIKLSVLSSLLIMGFGASAQSTISVNLNVKHDVGGIDTFDRSKYITLHASLTENDWNGEEDKLDYILRDLDVYLGRDNGSMPWNAQQVNEDPSRPGYADPAHMATLGQYSRETVYGKNKADRHQYEDKVDLMIGGQLNQFWLGNHNGKGDWQFGNTDAIGEYMGRFLNEYYRDDNQTAVAGHKRPKYLEILNEPLYELVDVHGGDPIDTFKYHNEVATAIRKVNNDVLIGGYTTAFPWFDERSFKRWDERMKLFIDTSGEHMDYFSIHLYDFNYLGRSKGIETFKGGRIEATLDIMEQYSQIKLGEVKPFLISEYGGRDHLLEAKAWDALNDWQTMKAFSPMMLQFMAKPDLMLKTIPFMLTKAEWSGNEGRDYAWRLMRHNDEKAGETGDHYVFSDLVKFYELWANVNGTRVDTISSEADLLVDSYVDKNKVYVIVSNLDRASQVVDLSLLNVDDAIFESINIKHLHLVNNQSELTITEQTTQPTSFTVDAEGTAIFEYRFDRDITVDETSSETKHYAATYLQKINANQAINFDIDGVNKPQFGEAVLRVGITRAHGKSLQPTVMFNNTALMVPTDFSGDEQEKREQFFSLLEIPVPHSLLQAENDIAITFADADGHITSTTLSVFSFSADIRPAADIAVTAVNVSPANKTLEINNTVQLTTSVLPITATNTEVAYVSDAPAVATVSATGLILAKSAGTAKITVTTTDGSFTASTQITVNAEKVEVPVEQPDDTTDDTPTADSGSGGGTLFWLLLSLILLPFKRLRIK
ncbi:Ig-like domain-containing protein [Algibacillus agarilyticus]|uniref:Ig-like domain-containing protein n=1 Tax=Algibacillus agarilyticus TaxID=2234133 RepID=UPI000DCF7DE9|nr:Ig-like domain-containing protein [Algibacillus agarilyticus]